MGYSPDQLLMLDDWSDLSRIRPLPEIDWPALDSYRKARLRQELTKAGAALMILVSPVSIRYAVNYAGYQLFQAHIPTFYLFLPADGPVVLFNTYGKESTADEVRQGRPNSFFDGGFDLAEHARLLADDVVNFLSEIGTDNRRVAVEYVNPSLTQALLQRGLEVIDGVALSEAARFIKGPEEIACMRWAIAVAEHGIAKVKEMLTPGVSELQLWGLLNYANLANNGGWHDGRMLASGPRINPWLQEASPRRIERGDLVGFDTDMIGPWGYFADISRTLFCSPGKPTKRQKEVYRLAVEEVEYNLGLIRPGLTFGEIQAQAFDVPEEFRAHAYPCILHGVGLCDEYPYLRPGFRGAPVYDGVIEEGTTLCVESFMGSDTGEPVGVKIEQQVLVTSEGVERLSSYPYEEILLD
ncbi:MAG: Xaa-Pro peptidase family protein [Limibacillus sp.]|jgi:Xaa-Pro dipeptidase